MTLVHSNLFSLYRKKVKNAMNIHGKRERVSESFLFAKTWIVESE
jgi:hypothetical protein